MVSSIELFAVYLQQTGPPVAPWPPRPEASSLTDNAIRRFPTLVISDGPTRSLMYPMPASKLTWEISIGGLAYDSFKDLSGASSSAQDF